LQQAIDIGRQHQDSATQAEARAQQAASREAESRAQLQQAIDVARQAQEFARQAESRVKQVESREAESRTQLQQAIDVARQSQDSAMQAEVRARQAASREAEARAQLQQAIDVGRQAQESARQAETATASVRQELHCLHQSNHHHWQLAEERGQHIQTLLKSTSWRVTAPMRWVVTTTRSVGLLPERATLKLKILLKPHLVRTVTSPVSKRMIERTGTWVIAHPPLSDPIRAFLRRHERLRDRLRWLVLGLPPGVVIAPQEESVELASRKARLPVTTILDVAECPADAGVSDASDHHPHAPAWAQRASTIGPAHNEFGIALPVILNTKGINARQRTPLESDFLAYAGREGTPSPRAAPNTNATLSPLEANFLAYAGREGTPSPRTAPNIDAILLRIREELERDSRK
jgi:hypothetical protein